MKKINLPKAGPCKHCGHSWNIRKETMPTRCGKCKRQWQAKEISNV